MSETRQLAWVMVGLFVLACVGEPLGPGLCSVGALVALLLIIRIDRRYQTMERIEINAAKVERALLDSPKPVERDWWG